MRPKKNHDKDLNRKRTLYFVLGLLLVLALIYIALEWEIEYDNDGYDVGNSPNKEIVNKYSTVVLVTQAN